MDLVNLVGLQPACCCLDLNLDEFVRSSAYEEGTSVLRGECVRASANHGSSPQLSGGAVRHTHPPQTHDSAPKFWSWARCSITLGHAGLTFLTSCSCPTLPPTRSSPWRLSASGLHAMGFLVKIFSAPVSAPPFFGVSHWSGTVQKYTLCSNWPAAAAFEHTVYSPSYLTWDDDGLPGHHAMP